MNFLNFNIKYIYAKNQNISFNQIPKKLTSTSNLPTANNSFYTISSFDQNESNLMDEYQEISFKNYKNLNKNRKVSYDLNNYRIDEDNETNEENLSVFSNTNDDSLNVYINNAINNPNCNIYQVKTNQFRQKYKTEICKFWQVNSSCKFGNKVNIIFNS